MRRILYGLIIMVGLFFSGFTAYGLEEIVDRGYQQGLTQYDNVEDFRADDSISRGEIAKFFARFAEQHGKITEGGFACEFDDIAGYDHTLVPYIGASCKYGLMRGSGGAFNPNSSLLGTEAITVVMRSIVGMQDEQVEPRRSEYVLLGLEHKILALNDLESLEDPISRGQVLTFLYRAGVFLQETTVIGGDIDLSGEYYVTRVVDGDTMIITVDGNDERVRLIGINTPETVHPSKPVQDYGPEASIFVTELVEGKKVTVEVDIQERDFYGRVLAYIWIDGVMLNALLVEEGLAQVSTRPPNVRYVDLFVDLQKQAQQSYKGIRSSYPEGTFDDDSVETEEDTTLDENSEESKDTEPTTNQSAGGKIDINSASLDALKQIIHINDERAQQLIALRPFNSIDSLTQIKGIGEARLRDIKEEGKAVVNE